MVPLQGRKVCWSVNTGSVDIMVLMVFSRADTHLNGALTFFGDFSHHKMVVTGKWACAADVSGSSQAGCRTGQSCPAEPEMHCSAFLRMS